MKAFRLFTTLFLIAGFSLLATSQNRISLVEEVTSASCGPCASQNPAFNALLSNNVDNVAIIKYQRGGSNYIDPMWDFNPDEVDTRIVGYYGVTSFPKTWIDGQYQGAPSNVNQSTIDTFTNITPTFDIDLQHNLNTTKDSITVTAVFKALQDFQSNTDVTLKVHMVVVEEGVHYSQSAGTNGEKDFFWVMRKMLTNSGGYAIGQQTNGQQTNLSYTYWIDPSELEADSLIAVAFVQRTFDAEVMQAVMTSSTPQSGIKETAAENTLSLYPTVANDFIRVELNLTANAKMQLEIIDITGKPLISKEYGNLSAGRNLNTYNVSELPSGLYFVRATINGEARVARFIVKK